MKLFIVLLAVAGLAFASGSLSGRPGGSGGGFVVPETDDQLDSYAYNEAEQLSSIGASFGDYMAVDDFTYGVDADGTVDGYICWGVTTVSAPTELDLLVVADASGMPDGAPVSQTTYTVTCGDTGYTYGGYTIWVATYDLTPNPSLSTPVWLGSYRGDGNNWYPVAGTTVSGSEAYRTIVAGTDWLAYSSQDPFTAADLFKVITGTYDSLSRTTWAGIKNMF